MTSSAAEGSLGAWLRRLPTYLYLVDLLPGRRVLEVGCGVGDGAQFLADHGAGQVVGVDRSEASIAEARARHRQINLEFRCEELGSIELDDGSFDCVFVPDGIDVLRRSSVLGELRRLLTPGGYLVLCGQSADRRGSPGGASFYEFRERLERFFPPVRMVAQAPFVGFSLVEFAGSFAGRDEPLLETHLDTSLMEMAGGEPEAIDYVAVCGGPTGRARGYAVVQVPERDGIDARSPRAASDARRRGAGRDGEAIRCWCTSFARLETRDRRSRARAGAGGPGAHRGRRAGGPGRRAARRERRAAPEPGRGGRAGRVAAGGRSEPERADRRGAGRAPRRGALAGDRGRGGGGVRRGAALRAGAGGGPGADRGVRPAARRGPGRAARRRAARVAHARVDGRGQAAAAGARAGEAPPAPAPAPRDGRARRRAEAGARRRAGGRAGARAAHLQEAEAQLQALRVERTQERERREGNGDGSQTAAAAAAESIGRDVARKLAHFELEIETGRSLIQQVENGLADLEKQAAHDAAERAPSAWAAHRDQQLRELSAELGIKDAEIMILHIGVSALRARMRELVGDVRRTAGQARARSVTELVELVEQLGDRAAAFEERRASRP